MGEPRTDMVLLGRLWRYIRPHRHVLYGALALNVVGVLALLAQPLILQRAIDDAVVAGDMGLLVSLTALFMGIIAVGFVSKSVGFYLLMRVGLKTLAKLRQTIFKHVMQQSQRFFDRRTTGSLMTRTTNDVDAIYESLVMGAVSLVTDALTIIGILIVMFVLDWKLTLVSFSLAPVIVWVVEVFRRKLRKLSLVIRESLSRLNGYFAEQVYGMSIVQTYGAQEQAERRFRTLGYDYLDAYRKSNWWDAGLYAIMDGMSSLSIGLMIWFGASQFTTPGSGVTLGLLVAFIDYLGRIYIPIRDFSGRFATIQRAVAALERIFGLLDVDTEVSDGAVRPDTAIGDIAFESVNFRYAEDRPQVLQDVSFRIAPGEVLAVVGATGSGRAPGHAERTPK